MGGKLKCDLAPRTLEN